MAHAIYRRKIEEACPRCGEHTVRIAIYHFGTTYMAQCSYCAFGESNGCDEDMAIARYRRKVFELTPIA